MTDFKTLLVDTVRPGVVQVTLNRPALRNAVDRTMHHELSDVFIRLRSLPDLGAIVLTGAGDVFCAGGDFRLMEEFQEDDWRRTVRMMDEGITLVRDLLQIPLEKNRPNQEGLFHLKLVFGTITFAVVNQGIYFTGFDRNWSSVIIGVMLLMAVLLNNTFRKMALTYAPKRK